jgi:hypothetical protein
MVPVGFQNIGDMQLYQPQMSRLSNGTITIGDLYGTKNMDNFGKSTITPRNLNYGNVFYPSSVVE